MRVGWRIRYSWLGRHTVYDLIRSRRLHSVRLGRCRRIPVRSLAGLLDSLTKEADHGR
ncbi:helix-turn-helix domain-containing protein [Rhizomonospora bruguierae]|uniref:helix-turn-helix domain-containing protein n=1 Tax=Rhizomonospora bruguierae TaxID=1581705 RepID=UPI001BCF84AA|nr:helix-turn-helix domain-containing protein [Micromonospora sp. NBRC 107566]